VPLIEKALLTESYDYSLPGGYIATHPIYPRDSAKLLVYERENDKVTHTTFRHFLAFLPQGCSVVINDTKVIKARIFGHKFAEGKLGGKVELLFNKPLRDDTFLVLIRGRVKEGTEILFKEGLMAKVVSLHSDGSRTVTFKKEGRVFTFEALVEVLNSIGHTPLPPYMEREERSEDEKDYQTLFASKVGAVAAPTASLHFTPELFEEMCHKHTVERVTLHVGAGTFKPVESETILEHPMHTEYYEIPKATQALLRSNSPLLAIGTTVTRTVEYFARTGVASGECDLFLHPHNPPQRVNHLLTNFHLPKSTLIMLVSAFVGREKTLQLYEEAIKKEYRFFSYGDAMLIV
jgi:S-adenosylmethionine:tRNA ribosyltransferase-isomerase